MHVLYAELMVVVEGNGTGSKRAGNSRLNIELIQRC